MQGLHLIADLHDCPRRSLLVEVEALRSCCRRAVSEAKLTIVGEAFHAFAPRQPAEVAGITGTLLLAESHVAIHTWPERGAVTLDVYVCNLEHDNSRAAEAVLEALMAAFEPARRAIQRVRRGGDMPPGDSELDLEWLTPSAAFGMLRGPLLFDATSPHQRVRVFDTPQFGRTLKVDNRFMTSEADDFFYHEVLVHPAAIAHPRPRRVFIAGGGDGGAAREVLKHAGVEQVVIAELDAAVVDATRRWLPRIHAGALDDARVELRIGDALLALDEAGDCGERFDLMLFDLTDPDTPAGPLYSDAAFAAARACLSDDGVLVVHLGSPTYHLDTVDDLVARLHAQFRHVDICGVFVPLYGCWWMMAMVSDRIAVAALPIETVRQRLDERGIGRCRFYSPAQHAALFVLPAFVEDALQASRA